ncbi:MAG: GNAT family N-acetyltransferase [Lactobacillales bacterium]|jgi:GNAT superfamily N-acetyltransferase|nr:GNAT family N-acetyltransferase [Lactobacillales bacterium]
MKFELFKNDDEFDIYLKIANLANGTEDIPDYYERELKSFLKYTQKMPDNYTICEQGGLLYALRDHTQAIIGTLCVTEDRYFQECAQIRHVAIAPEHQGKGYGKFMIDAIHRALPKHCTFSCSILSTVSVGNFYEKCGMHEIGRLTTDGYTRIFYSKKL